MNLQVQKNVENGCEGFNFQNAKWFLVIFKTSLLDSNKKGAIPCVKENNNNKIK